jgi:hypothetical protein
MVVQAVVSHMKQVFLFPFFLVTPLPSHAVYHCQQQLARPTPQVIGDSYTIARKSLLKAGWEPVLKSWSAIPEAEFCNSGVNASCDFIFKDNSSGYGLVIQATGKPVTRNFIVTGYYLRCHP